MNKEKERNQEKAKAENTENYQICYSFMGFTNLNCGLPC